ncbi:MAG: cytochrome c biogenesis protein CcdA, partial [Candidatus Pacearchaeota archaeon]
MIVHKIFSSEIFKNPFNLELKKKRLGIRMNKKFFLRYGIFLFIILTSFLANAQLKVHYFYGDGCPHCANVKASGVIDRIKDKNISVIEYQIYHNLANTSLFYEYSSKVGLSRYNRGIPFVVIECDTNFPYLVGDISIIQELESVIANLTNCEPTQILPTNGFTPIRPGPSKEKITLSSIIIGAAVDSINPCAFAVLIFLLVTLMSVGSRKRMLKAAFFYILAVYVTYFLAGVGIFKAIHSLTRITRVVYFASGLVVFVAGIIEIKDFFWYGKGLTLRISPKFKPIIDNIAQKGTLPAVILLGFLVSLFELPCTGGIYLAILTMMSINKTFALSYLFLYNLIFVLPLVFITLIIYRGTS